MTKRRPKAYEAGARRMRQAAGVDGRFAGLRADPLGDRISPRRLPCACSAATATRSPRSPKRSTSIPIWPKPISAAASASTTWAKTIWRSSTSSTPATSNTRIRGPRLWEGFAYAKHGEYHEAIRCYGQALVESDRYVPAYVNRGLAYMMLGENDKALTDFNAAVRLEPAEWTHYFKRGMVYERLGQATRRRPTRSSTRSGSTTSIRPPTATPPTRSRALGPQRPRQRVPQQGRRTRSRAEKGPGRSHRRQVGREVASPQSPTRAVHQYFAQYGYFVLPPLPCVSARTLPSLVTPRPRPLYWPLDADSCLANG